MSWNKTIILIFFCMMTSFTVKAESENNNAGKHYVLNLIGSGEMYESTVPDIDGDGQDDSAMCFDVQLINVKNNQTIGYGTDCLSKVTPTGTGVAVTATTFFHFPDGNLITRGKTTVQPVFHPTTTPKGQPITHITGASSDTNSIIGGTGRFTGASGKVRLSGMVNMAEFSGNVGDPIGFDCLFIVDLD